MKKPLNYRLAKIGGKLQADVELLIEYVYFLSFMSNICTLLVFLCRKILSLHKI